jgi:hypothetical protein
MKQNQFDKWSITRSKGMLRYVITHGLLAWGLPMFIMTSFIYKDYNKDLADILHKLFVYCSIGTLMHFLIWIYMENKYKKHINTLEN